MTAKQAKSRYITGEPGAFQSGVVQDVEEQEQERQRADYEVLLKLTHTILRCFFACCFYFVCLFLFVATSIGNPLLLNDQTIQVLLQRQAAITNKKNRFYRRYTENRAKSINDHIKEFEEPYPHKTALVVAAVIVAVVSVSEYSIKTDQ